MKTSNILIALLFLFAFNIYGQLKKIETPNVYYQAEIYKDSSGERYSTLINLKFNKRLIDLPKGKLEAKYGMIKNFVTKTLLKNIKQKYSDFKLKKVYADAVWGDNKRKNKRNGRWVTISERSQVFELVFNKPQPIDKIIEELKQDKNIEYIEGPAKFIPAIQPNDYYFSDGNQWELDTIDATKAWDITKGSANIHISINDLFGWLNVTQFHTDVINKFDYHYSATAFGHHGTKVAGVAAAETNNSIGVASLGWDTRLMGDPWWASYIDNAVARGADVINFSWITTSTGYRDEILDAIRQGVVCVAATGNDQKNLSDAGFGTIPQVVYPSGYFWAPDTQVIAVSSTIWDINNNEVIPSNWNYSPGTNPVTDPANSFVDFAAPGGPIKVTHDSLLNAYVNNWGTSLAAPQVSALCALLLSINNTLEPHHIYDILRNSAEKVGSVSYDANGWNQYLGYGRINAFQALKYTLENYGGTLNQNLTIPSGETWNFEPGVTVTFQNNSKLKVYGTLNVNGTSSNKVTFDFQAPYWYDINCIKFYEGSSGTIDNAEIKNGLYGIYIYKSSPTIKNSTIYDCEYGIMNYYNSPNILTNELYDITYTGIYSYKGSPKITDNYLHNIGSYGLSLNSVSSSTYVRKNTIDYCPTGVYAFGNNSVKLRGYSGASYGRNIIKNYNSSKNAVLITGGTPDLGQYFPYDQRGYNNLHWVTNSYVVKSTTSSQVMALFNYWGSSSPQYNWFYGNVEFAPLLGSAYSGAGSTLDKVANIEPDEQMLYDANELADSKSYQSASDKYKQLISDYPESKYGGIALAWSMATHQLTKDLETQRSYLQKQITHKSKLVSNSAMLWLQTLEAEVGNKEASEKVANSTSIKEVVGVEIRLNLANDLLNIYNDEKGAEAIFDELIKEDASESTLETIEVIKITAINSEEIEKSEKLAEPTNDKIEKVSTDFAVQNYPNPFNPSTTISYSLPSASNVKLEVYDVMGRMIKSFTTNSQASGKHQVVWNGTNNNGARVATGIYIYRFEAISLETNEHFVKSEKLMLVK